MTGQVELSAGTLHYEDTGGPGPVIVLLHGLMMDASLWADVIAELPVDYGCIAPTLPLGAHRHGMRSDADLSMRGIARLVKELLDRLELDDVTLAGNDTGGALVQLLMRDRVDEVSRVVLVSCDAFDNFPPGLTGKALVLAGKLPPALFGLFMQQLRLRPLRRLPIAFGWLTMRGDATTARWIKPVVEQREIRRDAVRMLRAAAAEPDLLLEAADGLPSYDRPALVVWASSDRVMPPQHGHRLTDLLPQGRLVEIPDSYTLIPLDQPTRLAQLIREFANASSGEIAHPIDTGGTPVTTATKTTSDPVAEKIDFSMMYVTHAALRRDLGRLTVAATVGNAGSANVRAGWENFKTQLLIHHSVEDDDLWPLLYRAVANGPEDIELLKQMEDEHAVLDPLLTAVDAALPVRTGFGIDLPLEELASALDRHLKHEEEQALPLIQEALTPADWRGFAAAMARRQGYRGAAVYVPWILDGAGPDQRQRILSLFPAPVRLINRLLWERRYRKLRLWTA